MTFDELVLAMEIIIHHMYIWCAKVCWMFLNTELRGEWMLCLLNRFDEYECIFYRVCYYAFIHTCCMFRCATRSACSKFEALSETPATIWQQTVLCCRFYPRRWIGEILLTINDYEYVAPVIQYSFFAILWAQNCDVYCRPFCKQYILWIISLCLAKSVKAHNTGYFSRTGSH